MTSSSAHQAANRCSPQSNGAPVCHPAAGAALVFQYVEERLEDDAEPRLDARIAELEQRNQQLDKQVRALLGHIDQLEEAIRQMQIGFRRHRSDKVDPGQLAIAFDSAGGDAPEGQADTADAAADEASETTCEGPCSDGSRCDQQSGEPVSDDAALLPASGGDGAMCSPPSPKRHNHGRRKIDFVPEIIVRILPAEVLAQGLESFERIGHEDSSVLGYRRGGPVKLVYRRDKFVRRPAQDGAAPSDSSTPGPASASPACSAELSAGNDSDPARTTDTEPTDTEASAGGSQDSGRCPQAARHQTPTAAPAASKGPGGMRDALPPSIEVLEHEALVVPEDASFRHNPFVDGAIVRFFPEALGSCEPLASDDLPPTSPVAVAPAPVRPVERGVADPSLLAHLFVDKLDRHLPYYRQEAELERFGWPVPRVNMARWQFECGQLVRPLTDAMWQQALARSWFAMDAAATAIRGSPRYERAHIFVVVAETQSVLFRFSSTYDGATVQQLFGPSTATILADASANHNCLFGPGKATEAGCWAHARRPFVTAFRAGEGAEPAAVLQSMQTLFRIEREIAPLEPAERLEVRRQRSAPVVDELLARAAVRRIELPADSLTRKGFVYMDNQKAALRAFLDNGELPLSNNLSERELRRFVKGRVNWLFHNDPEHAQSACTLASLIASAELHGLDPELYLQEVLTVLPAYPVRRVLELSPENWLATRERLLSEGHLAYLDLARISGSRLRFRSA